MIAWIYRLTRHQVDNRGPRWVKTLVVIFRQRRQEQVLGFQTQLVHQAPQSAVPHLGDRMQHVAVAGTVGRQRIELAFLGVVIIVRTLKYHSDVGCVGVIATIRNGAGIVDNLRKTQGVGR